MNLRPVTTPQLTKIHVLLSQFGITEDKADLVSQFTNGRETSSRKLTFDEAKSLLQHLSRFDPSNKMRRKVFALAYTAGIIYGDTPQDKKINIAKLDMFLKEKGTVKKALNKMSNEELIKVVNQFTAIKKNNDLSAIAKGTRSMLNEIGISTSNKRISN